MPAATASAANPPPKMAKNFDLSLQKNSPTRIINRFFSSLLVMTGDLRRRFTHLRAWRNSAAQIFTRSFGVFPGFRLAENLFVYRSYIVSDHMVLREVVLDICYQEVGGGHGTALLFYCFYIF